MEPNTHVHIYKSLQNRWYCDTGTKVCSSKCIAEKIIGQNELMIAPQKLSQIKFDTISSTPIPFSLNKQQAKIYEQQLTDGIKLPQKLMPECRVCSNGYEFDAHFKIRNYRHYSISRK